MIPNLVLTRAPNDCSVCALINASRILNIDLDYETALRACKYENLGSYTEGSIWLAQEYGLERRIWPTGYDYPLHITDYEADKMRLWNGLRNHLLDGWTGISQYHWDDVNDHAVVFSEYEDDCITVLCSMRGIYKIDSDWLRWKDRFQPVIFTNWLRRKEAMEYREDRSRTRNC